MGNQIDQAENFSRWFAGSDVGGKVSSKGARIVANQAIAAHFNTTVQQRVVSAITTFGFPHVPQAVWGSLYFAPLSRIAKLHHGDGGDFTADGIEANAVANGAQPGVFSAARKLLGK